MFELQIFRLAEFKLIIITQVYVLITFCNGFDHIFKKIIVMYIEESGDTLIFTL